MSRSANVLLRAFGLAKTIERASSCLSESDADEICRNWSVTLLNSVPKMSLTRKLAFVAWYGLVGRRLFGRDGAWLITRTQFSAGNARAFRGSSRFRIPPFLPCLWELLQYLFPPALRERVYEKAMLELLADYYRALAYRKTWKRLVLTGILFFRTIMIVAETWRVGVSGKVLPKRLRDWWSA